MQAEFEKFLEAIDLKAYRDKYRPIKLVEMDLPKDVQAIALMYQVYWTEKQFLSYDQFYARYLQEQGRAIENFRQKITMCQDCFGRGLPARIYRTWASIITQIHAGYVAEAVFGPGSVSMSEQLDHSGADFQVNYHGQILNYQVKKTSFSREVRQAKQVSKPIAGEFINIYYDVPAESYFLNPKRLDGNYRKPYLDFMANRQLKRLANGFIVFTPETFKPQKVKLDSLTTSVA